MRRALPWVLALACGRAEDHLSLWGRVAGVDGGDPTGLAVTLYHDDGATDFGCSTYTPWKTLTAGDGGLIELEYLREETAGRFGLNRCLRLEWTDSERTASLSWLGRDRDTQLPELLTWFDAPGTTPSLPTDQGGVLTPVTTFEVREPLGMVFRQVQSEAPLGVQLAGPGFEPANAADLVTRVIQRGQQAQGDSVDVAPLLEYEYRIEHVDPGFSGNHSWQELGHGGTCTVLQTGSPACALTDGLFTPISLSQTAGLTLDVQLPKPVTLHFVVVRGLWALKPFTTVIVEGRASATAGWSPGGLLTLDPQLELLESSSLEDAQAELFPIIRWDSALQPSQVRVRLEDALHAPVLVSWVGEISLY